MCLCVYMNVCVCVCVCVCVRESGRDHCGKSPWPKNFSAAFLGHELDKPETDSADAI